MKPFIRHAPAARTYTAAWRRVIEADRNNAPILFYSEFHTRPTSPAETRAYFLEALHARITARDPRPHGRKMDPDYSAQERRDRDRLRDIHNRIRIYQFETRAVRERFSHLLSHYDD